MQNPFESPSTANEVAAESSQFPFDVGNFVGRYLQVLAIASIMTMLVDWTVFGKDGIDLSFLFLLLAGGALRAHSQTARRWVIGISALAIVFCIGMTATAIVSGTDGMSIRLGRRIENPTLAEVATVSAVLSTLAVVPLGLLLTKQAKFEFAKPIRASIDRG